MCVYIIFLLTIHSHIPYIEFDFNYTKVHGYHTSSGLYTEEVQQGHWGH